MRTMQSGRNDCAQFFSSSVNKKTIDFLFSKQTPKENDSKHYSYEVIASSPIVSRALWRLFRSKRPFGLRQIPSSWNDDVKNQIRNTRTAIQVIGAHFYNKHKPAVLLSVGPPTQGIERSSIDNFMTKQQRIKMLKWRHEAKELKSL